MHYALALHGGAGNSVGQLSTEQRCEVRELLAEALRIGRRLLADGGGSLDCVEQVVRLLEDEPRFNAGRGSVLNAAGACELDAAIMDGRTRACGAVAGVRTVRHPVSLARLVMTHSEHVLLIAEGAEQFADGMQIERVAPDFFRTDRRIEQWRRLSSDAEQARRIQDEQRGTVGCVARDGAGNLAAATSTGGIVMKQFGRVGDSPLIGAGTFADNATCAVSCTGKGEQFIRHVVAYDVAARVAYEKLPVDEAVRQVLRQKLQPGDGGVIAVDRDGHLTIDFNTAGMYRAAADSQGRFEVGVE